MPLTVTIPDRRDMSQIHQVTGPTGHHDLYCSRPPSPHNALRRTKSEAQHEAYLDKLRIPTLQEIGRIAVVQEQRERELRHKRNITNSQALQRQVSAQLIQRVFREGRQSNQISSSALDPTTRWVEALKTARYKNVTTPQRRRPSIAIPPNASRVSTISESSNRNSLDARHHWQRLQRIATHALGDAPKEGDEDSGTHPHGHNTSGSRTADPDRPPFRKIKKLRQKWNGTMMDIAYYLEMVDPKHRYGNNLKVYNMAWKKADTNENFFYWLDKGAGKDVTLDACDRQTLEREQVRYLSAEERLNYLVRVDDQGRLCWAKNGELISTSGDFRDSVDGIVPQTSPAKTWREDDITGVSGEESQPANPAASNLSDSGYGSISHDQHDVSHPTSPAAPERRDTIPPPTAAPKQPPPHNLRARLSPHAILNSLLRSTLQKNTWIFASSPSGDLYVGLKQAGTFQHSSFLAGARLMAAGTIEVHEGRAKKLSPLSGHYRPPAVSFADFLDNELKGRRGVDLDGLVISKSFIVLKGLERWGRVKKRLHGSGGTQKGVAGQHADQSKSGTGGEKNARPSREECALDRVLREAKEQVDREHLI